MSYLCRPGYSPQSQPWRTNISFCEVLALMIPYVLPILQFAKKLDRILTVSLSASPGNYSSLRDYHNTTLHIVSSRLSCVRTIMIDPPLDIGVRTLYT